MFKFIIILLGLLAVGAHDAHAQVEWKAFESKDHKFKVDYPAPVRESKGTNRPDLDGYYYDFQSMIVPLRQSFDIRVVDDPYAHKKPTDQQLRVRLNRARDSAIGGLDDGNLIKEVDLRMNGLLGREVHFENEKFLAITQIHYFHKRMYVVTALMMKSKSDLKDFSDNATRFLNSFAILK